MLEIMQFTHSESGNEARATTFQRHTTNYSSVFHE